MTDEEYLSRKNKLIYSLFSTPPKKGISEKDFIDSVKLKISTAMSFDSTFFNDVIIKDKNMLDYYSSDSSTEEEKNYFVKTFEDIEILKNFQFNRYQFYDFVSNVSNGINNNKGDIYKKELDVIIKIIEIEWSRDIDTLLLDKYEGKNLISHILSSGFTSSLILNNALDNKKIEKTILNDKKIKFLKGHTKSSDFLNNLYFDMMYYLYDKNPNKAIDLALENKAIIENTILKNNSKLIKNIEDAYSLYEEDLFNLKFSFNEDKQLKTSTKKKMRI